jgi:hypothetical protein
MIAEVNVKHTTSFSTDPSAFSNFKDGPAPSGSKSLDFLNEDLIYIFCSTESMFFHYFYNIMIPALKAIESFDNKKIHFVLDGRYKKENGDNFDHLLSELLYEKQINYTTLVGGNYEYINAKNFVVLNASYMPEGVDLLYNYLIEKYRSVISPPHKKIYISRKNQKTEEKRIDNEEELEEFFKNKGFEVVYPEDFKTFKEQFEFFNSCHILAGISGSGLTNLMFMQKKQIVIEIVTQLEIRGSYEGIRLETHHYYKEMSAPKNHALLNIFNKEKSVESFKNQISTFLNSIRPIC